MRQVPHYEGSKRPAKRGTGKTCRQTWEKTALFDDSSGHAESDIGTLHYACRNNFNNRDHKDMDDRSKKSVTR